MRQLVTALSFVIITLAATAPAASAQTRYTWAGTNGSWHMQSNWSPNGVPAAADTAVVASGIATNDSTSIVGGLEISGGTLNGAGHLTVTTAMSWTSGVLEIDTLIVDALAALDLGGPTNYTINGTLVNRGVATMPTGQLTGVGQLVNEGEFVIAFDGVVNASLCFASPVGFFQNAAAGVLRRAGSGEVRVICGFDNHGVARLEQGDLTLHGFNATGGAHTGAFEVTDSTTLSVTGAVQTLAASGSIAGAGTVRVVGGTTTIAGTYDVAETIIGAGALNLDGPTTLPYLEITGGTLGGSASFELTDGFVWDGGSLAGSGTTIVPGDLSFSSGTKGLAGTRTLRLDGTTTWSGSTNINNGSTDITIENTGTFVSTGDDARQFFAGLFLNSGTFVHEAGTTTFTSEFNNDGEVNVTGGVLDLQGFNATGGTDTGNYMISDGATLRFVGGNRTLTPQAIVAGSGNVAFAGGAVTNGATWRPGTSPGTLAIDSNYDFGSSTLEIEVRDTTAGEFDQLVVSGSATLRGTLKVTFDGYSQVIGDRFLIVPAASATGAFDTLDLPPGVNAFVDLTAGGVELVIGSNSVAIEPDEKLPTAFALGTPYPNPVSDVVAVPFDVPEAGAVRLVLFDALGRALATVSNEARTAGRHEVTVGVTRYPAGMLFVRMTTESGFAQTRMLTVVK